MLLGLALLAPLSHSFTHSVDMDLGQVTTTQWATVAVGALASWLFLSWLSQPKSKHFKVPVPNGKTQKKSTPRVWMTMTPQQLT